MTRSRAIRDRVPRGPSAAPVGGRCLVTRIATGSSPCFDRLANWDRARRVASARFVPLKYAPVTSMPWADSSTICTRRQVITDPEPGG
jgi:hypothetical protein